MYTRLLKFKLRNRRDHSKSWSGVPMGTPDHLLRRNRHPGFLGGLRLTFRVAAFSFVFQSIHIVVTSVVRKSFVA